MSGLVALVAYEYTLTLGDEWAIIWRRKWNGSTILFFLNRYLLLFVTIAQVSPYTSQASYTSNSLMCEAHMD